VAKPQRKTIARRGDLAPDVPVERVESEQPPRVDWRIVEAHLRRSRFEDFSAHLFLALARVMLLAALWGWIVARANGALPDGLSAATMLAYLGLEGLAFLESRRRGPR
jgi:hypothetical protein